MAAPEQSRAFARVLQAFGLVYLLRQHHAAHPVGSERIDRDGGRQRAVDPARQAEDHAGKAVARRHNRAGRPSSPGKRPRGRHRARGSRACRSASRRASRTHSVTSSASSQSAICTHQLTVGMHDERRAVERQLVLAADAVEIGDRQAGLGHPRRDQPLRACRPCRARTGCRWGPAGFRAPASARWRAHRPPARCPRRSGRRASRPGTRSARAAARTRKPASRRRCRNWAARA